MPELPDVELYLAALRPRVAGRIIERVRIASPFFVRTYDPPAAAVEGHAITSLSRLGKRIVFALDAGLFIVVHLMIAGRLRWRDRGAAIPARLGLAAMDFAEGTLLFTEAGSPRRLAAHPRRSRAAQDGAAATVSSTHQSRVIIDTTPCS